MEPMLKKRDFRFQYLDKASTIRLYVAASLLALILLGLAAVIVFSASDSSEMLTGFVGVAIAGVAFAAILYLCFLRPRARRRRQMDWALAHI
jgi:hypothetical protein